MNRVQRILLQRGQSAAGLFPAT